MIVLFRAVFEYRQCSVIKDYTHFERASGGIIFFFF